MIVIFSKHALDRLHARPLDKERVESTLGNPDNTIKKTDHFVAVKKFENRVILVAYREQNGMVYVITVISSSKVDKYLKR